MGSRAAITAPRVPRPRLLHSEHVPVRGKQELIFSWAVKGYELAEHFIARAGELQAEGFRQKACKPQARTSFPVTPLPSSYRTAT